MESIVQKEKQCIVCHAVIGLHKHHIFFGGLRKISEKHGFTVYLCGAHHNLSNEGVHFNRELDIALKRLAQKAYEKTHSRKEFMELVGKNYLI